MNDQPQGPEGQVSLRSWVQQKSANDRLIIEEISNNSGGAADLETVLDNVTDPVLADEIKKKFDKYIEAKKAYLVPFMSGQDTGTMLVDLNKLGKEIARFLDEKCF